jgi:hypothetical protein
VKFIDPDGRETKEFYDPKEKKPNDATQLRNTGLIAAANYFKENLDNDNAIHIFAHGNKEGMGVYKNGEVEFITDDKQFETFLSENFDMWKNRKEGENITIVLHSCETSSFASKISQSEIFKNTTIIAPNKLLHITYSNNTFTEKTWEAYKDSEVPYHLGNERPKNEGRWIEYKNGTQSDYHSCDWKSSSVGEGGIWNWLKSIFK